VSAVPTFADWVRRHTAAHKVPGYRIVAVPLRPAGSLAPVQLRTLAELAQEFGHGELRVAAGSLALPHARLQDLFALWHLLDDAGLAPGQPTGRRDLPAA
jgi:sulfite reductase (NADPH) hemoprotein beta-component